MDNLLNAPWLTILGVALLLTAIVTVPYLVTFGLFYRGFLAEWRKQRKEHRARERSVPPHGTR